MHRNDVPEDQGCGLQAPPQGQTLSEGGREHFESVGHEERLPMSQLRTEYNRRASRASFPAWGEGNIEYRIFNIQYWTLDRIFDCPSVRDRVAEVRGRIAPWSEPLAAPPTTLFNPSAVCQAGMRRNDHFVAR